MNIKPYKQNKKVEILTITLVILGFFVGLGIAGGTFPY